MNKRYGCFILICFLFVALCSCMNRGPYSAPLKQPLDAIIKVDLLDGRNEAELFEADTYASCVIYSLSSSQIPAFVDRLQFVDFYIPSFEPSRHLGEIAVRICYSDGSSDILGSNCNYSIDPNFNVIDKGVYYPDEDAIYALFAEFVDSQLLPHR